MNWMSPRSALFFPSLCLSVLTACGEPTEPEPGRSSVPPATSPETVRHMDSFLEQVTATQAAIVRGDLDDARQPAQWLATHETIQGLIIPIEDWASDTPEGWEAHEPEIRAAAQRLSEAETFEEAASAAAKMAAQCGSCHREVGADPRVPELGAPGIPPSDSVAIVPHMLRHQWAVRQMWAGLINPSEKAWQEGAEVLADAALEPENLSARAENTERVRNLTNRVHELGAQARETQVWNLRAEIYGELLASCGGCHDMLGKGPR